MRRLSSLSRALRAGAFLLGGLLGGALSLPIPLAHLVLPWLLPIVGAVGAVLAFQGRGRVTEVVGTCVDCGAPFTADGGPLEEPLWIRCPACNVPLRVQLGARRA